MNADLLNYGDLRRAAALMAHYIDGDPAGVNALLAEADRVGRISHLVIGIMTNVHGEAPDLFTADFADRLRRLAELLAADEARRAVDDGDAS